MGYTKIKIKGPIKGKTLNVIPKGQLCDMLQIWRENMDAPLLNESQYRKIVEAGKPCVKVLLQLFFVIFLSITLF